MPQARRGLSLAPAGLVLERVEAAPSEVEIIARSPSQASSCPSCGTASRAVHSQYRRTLSDLPSHGHAARIHLQVRRFRCGRSDCRQRIFVERLDESIARPFARRLLLPVSKDTLLRVVRRHALCPTVPTRIVGIDDWAWKRGQRYGTIVCDLERHRIIDLLPDRETATIQSWLAARPSIVIPFGGRLRPAGRPARGRSVPPGAALKHVMQGSCGL